jgi:hypothetical protein
MVALAGSCSASASFAFVAHPSSDAWQYLFLRSVAFGLALSEMRRLGTFAVGAGDGPSSPGALLGVYFLMSLAPLMAAMLACPVALAGSRRSSSFLARTLLRLLRIVSGTSRSTEQPQRPGQEFNELWTKGNPTYCGKYVKFSDLHFYPKPVQKPHPPLWIGGKRCRRWAAPSSSPTRGYPDSDSQTKSVDARAPRARHRRCGARRLRAPRFTGTSADMAACRRSAWSTWRGGTRDQLGAAMPRPSLTPSSVRQEAGKG